MASVDDVVQQVWLELRIKWQEPGFEHEDPGKVVLGQVVRDYVREQVDELRKRSNTHRPTEDDVEAPEPGPGMEEEYIERVVDELLREALPDALATLTDPQRRAVELSTSGGYTREEIASTMGVRPGTVSGHRDRALHKLREVLVPMFAAIIAIFITFKIVPGEDLLPLLSILPMATVFLVSLFSRSDRPPRKIVPGEDFLLRLSILPMATVLLIRMLFIWLDRPPRGKP